ncbi:MAG: hypothetical protein HKN09_12485 [Saprospiraceae bacterium]|nr:hypothetical protein [Saprospiraceae bacterium]
MSYFQVNIDAWVRKNTYNYYKDYDDPYFNFTVNVDVSNLYHKAKSNNLSFFLSCLHTSLVAANRIENFKMRIEEGKLIQYDIINGGSTVLYDDGSFGFAYYSFKEDIFDFVRGGMAEIEERKKTKSFLPNEKGDHSNLIYFSSIPWFSFTSTKHANHHTINKSIPRISFGKYFKHNDVLLMPMSIEANHAIMDGYHFSLFLEEFDKTISSLN